MDLGKRKQASWRWDVMNCHRKVLKEKFSSDWSDWIISLSEPSEPSKRVAQFFFEQFWVDKPKKIRNMIVDFHMVQMNCL